MERSDHCPERAFETFVRTASEVHLLGQKIILQKGAKGLERGDRKGIFSSRFIQSTKPVHRLRIGECTLSDLVRCRVYHSRIRQYPDIKDDPESTDSDTLDRNRVIGI